MSIGDFFLRKVDEIIGKAPIRPAYGHAIGIILLETNAPRIPGNAGNATTYPFPEDSRSLKDWPLESAYA